MKFVEIHNRYREKEIQDWMPWEDQKAILDRDRDEFLFAASCSQCGCEGPQYSTERGAALLAVDDSWLLLDAGFRDGDFKYDGDAFCSRCRDEFNT